MDAPIVTVMKCILSVEVIKSIAGIHKSIALSLNILCVVCTAASLVAFIILDHEVKQVKILSV